MVQSLSDLFTACYSRDNHTCQDCGSTVNLEIHHILPISQGGKNTLDNLKTLCHNCHKNNYKNIHYPKDKSKIIPYELREKNRYGIDKSKNTQVIINIPNELMEQIITYRFDHRIPSMTKTIRDLVKKGLEHENDNN